MHHWFKTPCFAVTYHGASFYQCLDSIKGRMATTRFPETSGMRGFTIHRSKISYALRKWCLCNMAIRPLKPQSWNLWDLTRLGGKASYLLINKAQYLWMIASSGVIEISFPMSLYIAISTILWSENDGGDATPWYISLAYGYFLRGNMKCM